MIDLVALDLPETNFPTQALWYVLPDRLAGPAALPTEVLLGALHAAEHSQIAVLPLIAMCDRWDIGGLSTNVHFQTGAPTIFIYDGHPGGVGIADRGYELFERLVGDAARLVGECPCESGCPSCVQSPKCGNLNEPAAQGRGAGADALDAGGRRAAPLRRVAARRLQPATSRQVISGDGYARARSTLRSRRFRIAAFAADPSAPGVAGNDSAGVRRRRDGVELLPVLALEWSSGDRFQ